MKGIRIRKLFVFILFSVSLSLSCTGALAATGRQLADQAVDALKDSVPGSTSKTVLATLAWSWLEVDYNYEKSTYLYPITVDLVGSNFATASKVVYLLPGGGANFASSYFTPYDTNLAQFFRKAGFLVVCITPREDRVPTGISYSFMSDWGLEMHKLDIQNVISVIQSRLNKPYRVVGHSFGAAYALDYASTCGGPFFEKVIALDIYSYDHSTTAADSKAYFEELIADGSYVDTSYSDMKLLALASMLLPKIDSGEPRRTATYDYGPGNFTYEGLFYFALINSNVMEGADDLDWPLVKSYAAGVYRASICPLFDCYYLTKSDIDRIRSMVFQLGSGLVPFAVYRDWFDVSGQNTYGLDWSGMSVPVVWINTSLGYGPSRYCGGSTPTGPFNGVSGYGHLDILLGSNAQSDVWSCYNLDK